MTQSPRDVARSLIDEASARGIVLRLFGSLGVREHCTACGAFLDQVARDPHQDIDFMAYSSQQAAIEEMFQALSYRPDPAVAYSQEYGIQRLIYHHPDTAIKVEVFLDILRMSHAIDMRGRLERQARTIGLGDLLLTKLQIHEITEKDLKDIAALLAVHDLGSGDGEGELRYLLDRLRDDWGFYYTALGNLRQVEEALERLPALSPEQQQTVASRLADLTQRIEAEPKSMRWRLRAAVGPRVRWYEEVGDVER